MLLIEHPFCLDDSTRKPTCSRPPPSQLDERGHFPGTTTGQQVPAKKPRQTVIRRRPPLESTRSDFAELATGADYIHSPKLVNTRYSRQNVPNSTPPGTPQTEEPASSLITHSNLNNRGSGCKSLRFLNIQHDDGYVRGGDAANPAGLSQISRFDS